MAEQSHRNEMSAAIRAQRERQAVPKTIAPEPLAGAAPAPAARPDPEPEAGPDAGPDSVLDAGKKRKSLVERLRGK
jgi:hypothetical protein